MGRKVSRYEKKMKLIDSEENELDALFALQRLLWNETTSVSKQPLHCKAVEGQKNENSNEIGDRCI